MRADEFLRVVDLFPEAALLISREGTVVAANRAVKELGRAPQALTGHALSEICATPPTAVGDYLRLCARTRDPLVGALDLLADDGPPIACRAYGALVHRGEDAADTRLLLRLTRKETTPSHFAVLNRKIAELTEEIRRRKALEDRLRDQREGRREAEAALRQSEERFRALMEQAPFAVQVFTADGRPVQVNRAWQDLWGVTLADIPEYNILEDPQLEAKGVLPLIRQAFGGEAVSIPPLEYDPNETLPDRTRYEDPRRWVTAVAYPLKDASGGVREVVLVHDDITARKRAEQALQQSEEKFRLMADTIPQLAWMARPDGHIFWYNRRWYEYTGTTPEQMEGWGWRAVHDPAVLPSVLQRWRASLQSGEPFDMVFPLKGADGFFRPFLTRVNPLRGGGRTLYWFGTNTDISEQKRSEDAFRFLADASAALAALVDYESTLQKVASLAVPRFGDWCAVDVVDGGGELRRLAVAHVDPRKVRLAHELAARYPPRPDAPAGAARVVRTGEPEMAEDIPDSLLATMAQDAEHLRLLRELGLRSYLCAPLKVRGRVLGVLSFASAESGRRYGAADLALAHELASRAAVAVENARLYQELREADRRKDEFLATLAHELRNPLAPIRTSLQILKMPGLDRAVAERSRETMERQVQHLVRLVDDLLDVSRVMRGRIELRVQRVDLASVVSHAVEQARPLLDAHRHELSLSLPAEPLEVEGDPVRLAQVVGNLLANAAKYTPEDGHVWLTGAREGARAVLRIRDDGIGIAPEMLVRIFDLFVQAAPSLERAQGGLGIGLTLARSLVEMHAGEIEARSAGAGAGSEFVVRLPLAPPESPRSTAPAARAAAAAPRRRVLVVDDNVDAAESLALLLQLGGSEAHVAHDGATALRMAAELRPEVVFLDLGMPGMDGYEVARRLRGDASLRSVLLVALTGWGQEDDRRRSAAAGFDLHVVKPVEPGALASVLAHPKLRG